MSDPEVVARLTPRHLVTHTGGWVGDYFDDFGNGDDALRKMVESIGWLPQVTPLGELWSYNNAGFNIAGRLVEIAAGKPYETALKELLLDRSVLFSKTSRTCKSPHEIIKYNTADIINGKKASKVRLRMISLALVKSCTAT